MSAITIRLEQPEEASDVERAHAKCANAPGELSGYLERAKKLCPTPQEILDDSHTGLMTTNWTRQATEDSLAGREIHVMQGVLTAAGNRGDKREIYLSLDQPAGKIPLWNPPGDGKAQKFSLLSWTSKMDCPSWSLPAGHISVGGSCPAAAQSTMDPRKLEERLRRVGKVLDRPVSLPSAICQHCYAEGGQYGTGMVQYAQVLRFAWTKIAVRTTNPKTGNTYFFDTLSAAIANADYHLDGGKPRDNYVPREPKGSTQKYFRVHDSGDFYEPSYFLEWVKLTRKHQEVKFWAPTRMWAVPKLARMLREMHADGSIPANFIIRPSSYALNDHAPPPIPGMAAATVVIDKEQNRGMRPEWEESVRARERAQVEEFLSKRGNTVEKLSTIRAPGGPDDRYDWDCRAYARDDKGHTCRYAYDVDSGQPGCRVCWERPDLRVNYTLH